MRKSDDEGHLDSERLDNVEIFSGSAIVYGVNKHGVVDICACDYEVNRNVAMEPEQLRHHLLSARRKGKKAKRLPMDALDNEILVLLGRGASPAVVVKELERVIESIKCNGLAIGPEEDLRYEETRPAKRNQSAGHITLRRLG